MFFSVRSLRWVVVGFLKISFSSTFKWEESVNGKPETTYFKFDDNNGLLTLLDPNNENPAILGGVEAEKLEGGLVLNTLPIIQF